MAKYIATVKFLIDTSDYDDIEETTEAVETLVNDMLAGETDMVEPQSIDITELP